MARTVGLLLGALLIGYAVMLGISLGTGANVPMTTWVAPDKHKPAKTDAEAKTGEKRKSPILRNSAPSVVVPAAPTRITAPGPSAPASASAKPSATGSATPVAKVTPSASPAVTEEPSATPTRGKKPTAPPGKNKKTNETA